MANAASPWLSIIVPVYNGSAYIESLLSQLAPQDLSGVEILFVNDGSRDDTLDLLRQHEAEGKLPITVYTQENAGVSVARNAGLAHARGEYVVFVDVDDGVPANYVQVLADSAARGWDITVFDIARVREASMLASSEVPPIQSLSKSEILDEFLNDPTCFGPVNLLMRRQYLIERNIMFPVGYKYYEDYDFLLQVFAQTDTVGRLPYVLYYYVMREGSATAKFTAERVNCLALMKARGEWLVDVVPSFAPRFKKVAVPRLYWSVLWQAALAFPRYRDFAEFAKVTGARRYLANLKGYPDRLLRLSTRLFLISGAAYYAAVRAVGRCKSAVAPAELSTVLEGLCSLDAYYGAD